MCQVTFNLEHFVFLMCCMSWNIVNCCTSTWKIAFKNHAVDEWRWRWLRAIRNDAIWWVTYHVLLMVCCNKLTPSLSDLTLLQCTSVSHESFSINMKVEITATCAFWFLCKHISVNISYISRGIRVRVISSRVIW